MVSVGLPGLIPTLGFMFFPTTFFVGPQISFAHYAHFVHGFPSQKAKGADPLQQGWVSRTWRLTLTAAAYFASTFVIGEYAPITLLESPWFLHLATWQRIIVGPFLGRLVLHRYLGIWLFVEAPSVLYGVAFRSEGEKESWTATQNIDPYRLETATSLKAVISAFNISTNLWSKNYIFKRLRWLGNKQLSQLGTLFFLAIWHGFHAGYFLTFALEFFVVLAEGYYEEWFAALHILQHPVIVLLRWVFTQWFLGFPLVGFEYKTWTKTMQLWSEQAFAPVWCLAGIILLYQLWRLFARKPIKAKAQ